YAQGRADDRLQHSRDDAFSEHQLSGAGILEIAQEPDDGFAVNDFLLLLFVLLLFFVLLRNRQIGRRIIHLAPAVLQNLIAKRGAIVFFAGEGVGLPLVIPTLGIEPLGFFEM